MIPETPNLQRKISSGEERYTNLIKQEFIKHAKEINRLEKDIDYKYCTKDEVDIAISEALADLLSTSADIIESLDDIGEVIDSKLDKNSPDYVKEVVVDGQNVVVTTGDNRTSVNQLQIQIPEVPTKTSDLINDNGYITSVSWNEVKNKPNFAMVATSASYTDLYDTPSIPERTSELINDSGYITGVSWDEVADKPEFATVATSGSYLDLSNTPTIPTKVSDLTNDTGYITGVSWNEVTGKPNFATVATSGSYTDLSNKPTIPTVPTNVSAFNNDSGYITGVAWDEVTDKPSTFPPSNHNHNNDYLVVSNNITGTVKNGEDLNDYTTPGTYRVPNKSSADIANRRIDASHRLIVMYTANSNYLTQIAIYANTIAYRCASKSNNVWNWDEWRTLANTSSNISGNAATATALTTSAGSATNPVYFSDGKPVATTYTLEKSVPSDAVFTDTVYTHPTTSGNKHIPSGGSAGNILKWSSDGTAVWGDEQSLSHLFDLSLTEAVEIPANADLDDYKTPGVYYAPSSTRAGTLSHCPHTTSNFKLVVMDNGIDTSYKCQYIYAYDAKGGARIYARSYGTSTTGWYAWKRIAFQDEIKTYTAGTGIAISSSNAISNSGVRSITTGTANGTVSVDINGTNTDIAVKGLGSAAYTESTDYATVDHTHDNYVDLTSKQTITGQKIFQQQIVVNRNIIAKGTPPSSTQYPLWIGAYEKGDGMDIKNRFGAVGTTVYKTTGNTETALLAYKNVANSTLTEKIGVFYPTNGDPYGFAPTPASTSNTNHIATTEWVNTKLDDYEVDLSNKPRTIEFIAGTQTAATPSFTGVSGDSALYDGKIIAYYLPFAGTSAGDTLELTLSNNTTTGAKPVWYRNQVVRLTTHYPANAIILMVYDATDDCWICGGQYNTTYSSMTVSEMDAGTATTGRLVTAARLHNKIKDMINQAMTANGLNTI